MNVSRTTGLLAALTAIALLSGCSRTPGSDAKFAREVIDAVYAGSLRSLQDSLTPQMRQAINDTQTAQLAAGFRQQYGEVKSLKLKSSSPVQGMTQDIWAVTAERGTFDMRLVIDKDGKLAGLWF